MKKILESGVKKLLIIGLAPNVMNELWDRKTTSIHDRNRSHTL